MREDIGGCLVRTLPCTGELCLVVGEGLNLCFWEREGHFWSWVMTTHLPAHADGVDPVLLGEVLCRLLVSRAASRSVKLYLTTLKAPGIPKIWTSSPRTWRRARRGASPWSCCEDPSLAALPALEKRVARGGAARDSWGQSLKAGDLRARSWSCKSPVRERPCPVR